MFHRPRDTTVDLLCELISIIPIKNLEEVNKTFPLLTAQSRVIQRAAYIVLHRYIPEIQEQISLDVALSGTSVKLPYELMSLLLEPPTMDSISASLREDRMWTGVRSYLLSWKVVFDHFTHAVSFCFDVFKLVQLLILEQSAAVQEQYAASIKEDEILSPLLGFTFDFLQGAHGKIVDASKFDVRNFEPDQSETAEKETQWLLIHLYFLSLRHLANIAKNWWIDSPKRIKGPMESWTERYVGHDSPLLLCTGRLLIALDLATDYRGLSWRRLRLGFDTRSQRGTGINSQGFSQDSRNHRKHRSRRGIATRCTVHFPSLSISPATSIGYRTQSGPRRREEMEELAAHHPGSHHVCQWQPGGWIDGIPEERARSTEGPERVRNLLLGDLNRHADTEQTMCDLQEHLPLRVSVPVVQEQ